MLIIHETGAELLKALRAPEFILPTILFPLVFFTLFAIVLSTSQHNTTYLLATYGIFAVMGPALFGFGVGVANEKDRGWLELKRALPVPAYSYVLAKTITTLVFASLALLPIYLVAGFAGDVQLPTATWATLFLVHLFSAIPFVMLGVTMGFRFSANGAVALTNIAFFGLTILGGLWFPVSLFPSIMQTLSKLTPSYHLAEISLAVIGVQEKIIAPENVISISVATLLLAALAIWSWKSAN